MGICAGIIRRRNFVDTRSSINDVEKVPRPVSDEKFCNFNDNVITLPSGSVVIVGTLFSPVSQRQFPYLRTGDGAASKTERRQTPHLVLGINH